MQRRYLGILAIAAGVALGVFALWVAVADAPWESGADVIERTRPVRIVQPNNDCENILRAMETAPYTGAWRTLDRQARAMGCY